MTGILNAISGMAAGASSLYAFTSFEFTNAGQTGQSGPTLGTCLSTYNTTTYPWLNNTAYFNVVTPGIQLWTVPKTGNYTIQAKGAPGGASSSNVASITGTFALTRGDKIRILVGQAGATGTSGCGNSMGGGGGGTNSYMGGGGGGYNGGGSGGVASCTCSLIGGGGGGGSYNNGTNQTNTIVTTTGQGSVIITAL